MGKRKKVSYQLIKRDSDAGRPIYAMLKDLIEQHHEELTNARLAVAWNLSWKPDADGRVTLGKCKKASDLDRELAAFDFVILLQAEFWQDAEVTEDQRRALLDHELCHATVKLDETGEPARDERDRIVYRIRKHDVEEFSEIVRRHGCYKRDLEQFAAALRRSKQASLLDLRDEIVDAGLTTEAREVIQRVRAGENGADVLADVVRKSLEPDVARAATDPKVQRAVEALRPKPGSGIDSLTISSGGGKSITLKPHGKGRA